VTQRILDRNTREFDLAGISEENLSGYLGTALDRQFVTKVVQEGPAFLVLDQESYNQVVIRQSFERIVNELLSLAKTPARSEIGPMEDSGDETNEDTVATADKSDFSSAIERQEDPIPALVDPIPTLPPPSPQVVEIGPGQTRLLGCFGSSPPVTPVDKAWLMDLQNALQSVLKEFGIDCVVDSNEFEVGPRLIRADFKLGKGVLISKVKRISESIANKLFANKNVFEFSDPEDVPMDVIVESVPVKGMVGIALPRKAFEPIGIGNLLKELVAKKDRLAFVIGTNTVGQGQFADLLTMPHLLVAGQPRAGKSVFLNTMIVSLAIQNKPQELQLILIDPKGLEFGTYSGLPHVCQARVFQNPEEAQEILRTCREEMEERYATINNAANKGVLVKDIREYNNLAGIERLPHRVIIIDEFSDLVLSENKSEIIKQVQAIAQKGAAAGLHVVLCTQRPDVNVVPGNIKAVFPSRMSFRLPTSNDSKVILDEPGAEGLLGKGDLLLKETDKPGIRRYQGAHVTNHEIQEFVATARDMWGDR